MKKVTESCVESDAVLYIKFFARCLLVLGIPSLIWAMYVSKYYSVNLHAAMLRLGLTFAMVAVGFSVLALLKTRNRVDLEANKDKSHSTYRFLGGRIDGLLFFGSIPAILGLLFMLPWHISAYLNSAAGNSRFDSVKVQIDFMEIKHVPEEKVDQEEILKFFLLPSRYIDLWLACGKATLLEINGSAIEQQTCRVTFSIPKTYSTGTRKSYRTYICHHKMDAEMDSESYHVGKIYSGWMLRENPEAGVIFSRPSDKVGRELVILTTLLLSACLYLYMRIVIGRRTQDSHWNSFLEIWTK